MTSVSVSTVCKCNMTREYVPPPLPRRQGYDEAANLVTRIYVSPCNTCTIVIVLVMLSLTI